MSVDGFAERHLGSGDGLVPGDLVDGDAVVDRYQRVDLAVKARLPQRRLPPKHQSPSTRYMILAHIRSRGPFTHMGPLKLQGPLQWSLTLILMETEFIAYMRS